MNVAIAKQRGVVILENLIAVLIFSIGILGLAGLLAASMKNTASAAYRNEASMLASQIIGQMWLGDRSNGTLKTNFESPDGTQYLAWKNRITGDPDDSSKPPVLPGVDSYPPTITIDNNNVATVTVRWKAPGEATSHSYIAVARING